MRCYRNKRSPSPPWIMYLQIRFTNGKKKGKKRPYANETSTRERGGAYHEEEPFALQEEGKRRGGGRIVDEAEKKGI